MLKKLPFLPTNTAGERNQRKAEVDVQEANKNWDSQANLCFPVDAELWRWKKSGGSGVCYMFVSLAKGGVLCTLLRVL